MTVFLFAGILFFAWPSFASLPPVRVALLPFDDQAGFQGAWKLASDVPRLLGTHLDEIPGIAVVASEINTRTTGDLAEMAKQWQGIAAQLDVDVLIRGRVSKFGVRRTVAGDPNTFGYKSYTHSVKIDEIELIDGKSGSILSTLDVRRDSVERPIDFSLFGKPNAQDREFRELLSAEFASEKFFALTFGQHVQSVFGELSQAIADSLLGRAPIALREDAKVLAVDGVEIYLNIGNGDLVRRGDIFSVMQNGQHVGAVRIEEIIGQHLSKAAVIDNEGPIQTGLSLGARLVPGETKN